MTSNTVFRQCIRKACMFRFPGPDGEFFACPKCGAGTTVVALFSHHDQQDIIPEEYRTRTIEAGLDNLRSILNVGSIFRTADAVGIRHIHLFGITPSPIHPRMQKTSLGAEDILPWTQHWDGLAAVRELKSQGYLIAALEKTRESQNLFDFSLPAEYKKILLIAGNENTGIDPGILAESNYILHLPMLGSKESLNVANAFAVAAYWFRFNS